MNIFVVRGLPGSGKTTKALELQQKHGGIILSAEGLFKPFNFKSAINNEAMFHANRLILFMAVQAIEDGVECIIVDDSSSLKEHHQDSFRRLAEVSGRKFELVKPGTPWEEDVDECMKRTSLKISKSSMQSLRALL